jgi:hypothetical protein
MKTFWHRLAQFFEDGDLTPFAVLISIVHYGDVLAAHGEHAIVAYAIGTLVDLIHFRTIRRAFMPHNNRQETIVNWLVAAITTFMASMYHWRFYEGDYLLALPIPVGIAILAYHAADKQSRTLAENETSGLQATVATLQADNNDLRDRIKEQQAFMRLWRKLGKDGRIIVQAIAGEITKEQATEQTGWDVRTVGTYIDRMNGAGK